MTVDESTLRNIIKKAIQEQKLFELIFGKGKRLWASWPREKFQEIVKQELKRAGKISEDR